MRGRMRSRAARAAIAVATLAAVVVLFIVLAGGDDNDDNSSSMSAATSTQSQNAAEKQVVVRGGEAVGGVEKLEYDKGDRIRFVVRSDVADEIHVHGYDVKQDIQAGGSARFSFPADIEGVFEIELEDSKLQIAELRVNP